MKKIIFLLLLLVFSQAASGEKILTVDFDIHKNNSVNLRGLGVLDGSPTVFIPEGDYKVVIRDAGGAVVYEKSIEINFLLYTDPPIEVDKVPVTLKIAYVDSMRLLEIYHKGKLIFSKTIEICNNNSICEKGYESHLSCPSDCSMREDGVCTPNVDGVCDIDCASEVDLDCVASTTTTEKITSTTKPASTTFRETTTTLSDETTATSKPAKEDGGVLSFTPVIVVLVAAVVLAFFGLRYYRRMQEAKIEKQREDFLRWKEEQEKGGRV